jgi:hypothetical protein
MTYFAELVLERDGAREVYGLRTESLEAVTDLLTSMKYRLQESLEGAQFISARVWTETP